MKNNTEYCRCEKCAFKSLPVSVLNDDEIAFLSNNSIHIKFNAGENIIRQGAFTTNIAYQTIGLSKIYIKGPLNKDAIIKISNSPSFIGLPSVFSGRVFQYSVAALTKTEVCFIDYNCFEKLLANNGKFATELIKLLSKDLINQYNSCVNKTQKRLNAYIAEVLLHFAESIFENNEFYLPLSRNEFAQLVGSTRETITRVLHDFMEMKILEVSKDHIRIVDNDKLMQISRLG